MSKLLNLLSIATLSAAALACPAQGLEYQTQAPAPVERSAPNYNSGQGYGQPARPQPLTIRPAEGLTVRSTTQVQVVGNDAKRVEVRLDHGIANVTVHHPAHGILIQVDLPGGQTALKKDGLYTFNADTNTVRTLKGEAFGYTTAAPDKGIAVKEYHELVFNGPNPHAGEFLASDVRADLLVNPAAGDRGYGYRYERPYGYGGYYGYPYYAYGYPYGWGSPYGWGYPGIGIGFGYYGGFRGGFGGRGFRR